MPLGRVPSWRAIDRKADLSQLRFRQVMLSMEDCTEYRRQDFALVALDV
jgi:hypothetical protein